MIKAHPALRPSFHRVVIARATPGAGSGPPVAVVRGPAYAPGAGQQALVSISHDGAYATAVCVGFEADRP